MTLLVATSTVRRDWNRQFYCLLTLVVDDDDGSEARS